MTIVFYGKSTLEHLCKYSMCIDGEHLEKGWFKEFFFKHYFLTRIKVSVSTFSHIEFKTSLRESKSFIYAPRQHFEYNSILDPYI